MNIYPLIFLFIFFAFRYIWSFIGGKRKRKKVTLNVVFLRKLFEVFMYFLMPIFLSFSVIPGYKIFEDGKIFLGVGIIFASFGLVLMIWTRLTRKREWGLMGDESADNLVTKGAYSVTRHPYYVGAVFLITGVYLQYNSWWILLIIPGILFLVRVIRKEDMELEIKFGEEFIKYKKKVGIFPWIN